MGRGTVCKVQGVRAETDRQNACQNKKEKKGTGKMIYIAALVLCVLFVLFLLLAAGLGAMADREAEKRERES